MVGDWRWRSRGLALRCLMVAEEWCLWNALQLHRAGRWLSGFDAPDMARAMKAITAHECELDQAWEADRIRRSNAYREFILDGRQRGEIPVDDKTLATFLTAITTEPRPEGWPFAP